MTESPPIRTAAGPPAPASPPGGWPLPRAVYLHVPFCRHRCGYCNFSVVAGRDELADRFLDAIDRELALLDRPTVSTIFVGGGTPTHLSDGQLRRLLSCIHERLVLADSVEWSVEANPEDIDDETLATLKDAGVNRVSLGVQSFHDPKLQTLERGHSGGQAAKIVERVAAAIDHVSIDLIFACPGESLAVWEADLRVALGLPIDHLSTYALTFEKGTSFWNLRRQGVLESTEETLEVAMYQLARQRSAEAGLRQYEISNFARPNAKCRHNLAYWDGQGWFAAGPGAARFVEGRREVNHRSPTTYLKRIEQGKSPTAESESLSLEQYARERAAFGIRLMDGIHVESLSESAGFDLRKACGPVIERAIAEGLLEESAGRVKLTERGLLFADTVASDLLG